MSERFNDLYSLSNNLYLEGFPFVISAGKLLFDTQKGKSLVQLKIKNLSEKNVIALKIKILCFDIAKHELGDNEFTYLDLTSIPNTEFGQKTPIYLPFSETRSYEVNFIEAVFSDGSVKTAPVGNVLSIPTPDSLAVLGKEESQEFKHICGEKCIYLPKKYQDFWICSCGTLNSNNYSGICHNCENSYDSLAANADKDFLAKHRSERLEKDEAERKERVYTEACKKDNLENSIKLLESVSGYKDADELCEKYKAELEKNHQRNKKIGLITASILCTLIALFVLWTYVIHPNIEYTHAKKLMEQGDYIGAISAFEAMNGYRDSEEKIDECNIGIPDQKYNHAVSLMQSEEYEKALSIFETLCGHKDSEEKIEECNIGIIDNKYDDALALMNSNNIVSAYETFVSLNGYKDSAAKAASIFDKYKIEFLKKAKVEDCVFFGLYEQDDNLSNGKENIEWYVIDKQDNKILVMSKYGLDKKPYNITRTYVTWETCSLRRWLNNDFLNSSFSSAEKAAISSVTNITESGGISISTLDKVFLLSEEEARYKYRMCITTRYANAQKYGAGISAWWLRSVGKYSKEYDLYYSEICERDGKMYGSGMSNEKFGVVRPALWIDLTLLEQ